MLLRSVLLSFFQLIIAILFIGIIEASTGSIGFAIFTLISLYLVITPGMIICWAYVLNIIEEASLSEAKKNGMILLSLCVFMLAQILVIPTVSFLSFLRLSMTGVLGIIGAYVLVVMPYLAWMNGLSKKNSAKKMKSK